MYNYISDNMNRNIDKRVKKNYKTNLISTLVIEVILLLLGLVLIFVPKFPEKAIIYLVSVLFILFALNVFMKYKNRDGAKLFSLNLVWAIIIGILALLVLLFIKFLPVLIGLFLIITGTSKINYSLWLKKGEEESWVILLALSLGTVLLGILLIFNPFAGIAVNTIIGVFLSLSAILRISDTILFKKREDEIMDIFW